MEEDYAAATALMGDFGSRVDLTGAEVQPGTRLLDRDWLATRVEDTGRRWACDDTRVNATLWWYSASVTLVAAAPGMLLAVQRAPDPNPHRQRITLQPNGYLAASRSDATLAGVDEYATALPGALGGVIETLAEVSGASTRALWAIASDSLAGRALEAGRLAGDVALGTTLAHRLSCPPLLAPRYVDVDPFTVTSALASSAEPESARRYVRRSSCCLIYAATGGDKCLSCPRQRPLERAEGLQRHRAQHF